MSESNVYSCNYFIADKTHSAITGNSRQQIMYLYQVIFCLTVIYCALLLCHALENAGDHYKTLGLERTASERDIKRAFRELALKYHPDKNKKKGAQEKFMDITKGSYITTKVYL